MKKLNITVIFLFCALIAAPSIKAATVSGTPPTINITNLNGVTDPAALDLINIQINLQLSTAFENAKTRANSELEKYKKQKDLAKGFANSNVYAAQAATQQGFQDYELFAVTSGAMVGVQLPSSDPSYYENIDKKV